MALDFDGKSIPIRADAFIGSVDTARLTAQGAHFTCWAVSNPAFGETPTPPSAILATANGTVVYATPPTRERADIARKFGPQALKAGCELALGLDVIPRPFNPDFVFYALGEDGVATALPYFAEQNMLAKVRIEKGSDFIRLIQNPATRLSDPKTLGYTALHCMRRFGTDFSIKAAAICVIGYRILEKDIDDPDILKLFEAEKESLLSEQPDIPRGLFLRWHTSMRLIAGYLAFQSGKDNEALRHFTAIVPFIADLSEWPQSLTNLLLGLFLTGYFNFLTGNKEAAIEHWSRAPEIFRYGCSIAEFQNYYAYGEVGNALRVVQECYVAAQVVKGGGPITNVSLAPAGRTLDLRQLPSPIARLAKQREDLAAAALKAGAAQAV